jgi:mannose-6-phosphate isomerase-like protein (cupin superfamily)
MQAKRPHLKTSLLEIPGVPTAHNSGTKKILSRGFHEKVVIRQVAVAVLEIGERVEPHTHADLDEYYFILRGAGKLKVNDTLYELKAGDFIIVTAGSEHEIRDISETLEFYYQSFEIIPCEAG